MNTKTKEIIKTITIGMALAIGIVYALYYGMGREINRRCWVARQNCEDHPEYCQHEYIAMCDRIDEEES